MSDNEPWPSRASVFAKGTYIDVEVSTDATARTVRVSLDHPFLSKVDLTADLSVQDAETVGRMLLGAAADIRATWKGLGVDDLGA